MTLASSLAEFVLAREFETCLHEQTTAISRLHFDHIPPLTERADLFRSILESFLKEDPTKVILPEDLKQKLSLCDWEMLFSIQKSCLLLRIPRLFQQTEVAARTAQELIMAYATIFLGILRSETGTSEEKDDEKIRFYYNQLKERENELQQLVRHAPDAIIVINADGLITLWNPKAEEIFGWRSSEVAGRPLSETIIPHPYREAHAAGMKRFLQTKEAHVLNQTIEITALNKDGREFPVSLKISHFEQSGNDIFIAFLRNIEAQKKNETELHKKKKELEQTNLELEQYAWLTSHDLREPLRKILTYSDLILSHEKNVPQKVTEKLQKISASAKRMGSLIKAMLTYSSISDDADQYMQTPLQAVVKEVLSDLELIIQETQAKIEVGPLPVIDTIPHQMRQVFQNLISNGIKYRKKDLAPLIRIDSKNHDANHVAIYVEDNGIGFDSKEKEKIFVLFHRLNTLDKREGTGIGLAICKKIIQNHGGSITVESKPGEGARFTIVLPFRRYH